MIKNARKTKKKQKTEYHMFVTQQAMNQHKGKVPFCPVFFSLF